jgi:hypothetical protein
MRQKPPPEPKVFPPRSSVVVESEVLVDVVLVDPYLGGNGLGPSQRVLEVMDRHPMNPVVAALELSPKRVEDVRTLLAWGVSDLLAWMRLFLAAALLERTDRTTGSVAAACGYATKHALRRAMRELLGGEMPAREEVWEAAARGFTAGLREAREAARGRRAGWGEGDTTCSSRKIQKRTLAYPVAVHHREPALDLDLLEGEQIEQNTASFLRVGRAETQVEDAGGDRRATAVYQLPEVPVEGDENLSMPLRMRKHVRIRAAGRLLPDRLHFIARGTQQTDTRSGHILIRQEAHQRASGTA